MREGKIIVISNPGAADDIYYMTMVAPREPSMLEVLRNDPDYLAYLADFQFQAWLAEQYRILRESGLIR